jgi:hypothetical protein
MAEMLDLDLVASTAEVENLLIATLDKQVLTDAGQFLREICDNLIEPFPIVVRDEHHGVETTAIALLPFGLRRVGYRDRNAGRRGFHAGAEIGVGWYGGSIDAEGHVTLV